MADDHTDTETESLLLQEKQRGDFELEVEVDTLIEPLIDSIAQEMVRSGAKVELILGLL